MTFPQLARFTDVALLLLRLMVAIVFPPADGNICETLSGAAKILV
jgi:hypothetical protein